MSYDPNRTEMSEFMTAWNSSNQAFTTYYGTGGNSVDRNITLNLDTVGEGDASIVSNVLTPQESLYGFFIGDLRVNTDPVPDYWTNVYGDLFAIKFDQNDGDFSSGGNVQRANRQDDQCYSIASSAHLKIGQTYRLSGQTISPWVRIIGILIER